LELAVLFLVLLLYQPSVWQVGGAEWWTLPRLQKAVDGLVSHESTQGIGELGKERKPMNTKLRPLGLAWVTVPLLFLWAAPAQASIPWWDAWRGPVATLMSQAIVENEARGEAVVSPTVRSTPHNASGEAVVSPPVQNFLPPKVEPLPFVPEKPKARKLIGYRKVCSGGVCRYEPVYEE
jgi:hypothetical protein